MNDIWKSCINQFLNIRKNLSIKMLTCSCKRLGTKPGLTYFLSFPNIQVLFPVMGEHCEASLWKVPLSSSDYHIISIQDFN